MCYRTLHKGSLEIFSKLGLNLLFLGGGQLMALGILGEYIGRIFKETKGRPAYFIDEYSNLNVKKDDRSSSNE
ncbi:hypothetical protein RsTz2092_06040 [Deferribacterales bacterium RsTz2092]